MSQFSMKPEALDNNFGEIKQEVLGTIPDGQFVQPRVIFKKSAISALATGSTKIGTTDANKTFIPESILVVASAGTVFTSVGSLSVGTNSTNYDNIQAITAQTGLAAIGKSLKTNVGTSALASVPGATDIYAHITTAAAGTGIKYDVYVIGFYA